MFRAPGEDRKNRLLSESRRSGRTEAKHDPIVFETVDDFLEAARIAEANKWIQRAVKKPGRCSNPGSADCPKGSPQYRLAMRFKKGGDIYKANQKKNK